MALCHSEAHQPSAAERQVMSARRRAQLEKIIERAQARIDAAESELAQIKLAQRSTQTGDGYYSFLYGGEPYGVDKTRNIHAGNFKIACSRMARFLERRRDTSPMIGVDEDVLFNGETLNIQDLMPREHPIRNFL